MRDGWSLSDREGEQAVGEEVGGGRWEVGGGRWLTLPSCGVRCGGQMAFAVDGLGSAAGKQENYFRLQMEGWRRGYCDRERPDGLGATWHGMGGWVVRVGWGWGWACRLPALLRSKDGLVLDPFPSQAAGVSVSFIVFAGWLAANYIRMGFPTTRENRSSAP